MSDYEYVDFPHDRGLCGTCSGPGSASTDLPAPTIAPHFTTPVEAVSFAALFVLARMAGRDGLQIGMAPDAGGAVTSFLAARFDPEAPLRAIPEPRRSLAAPDLPMAKLTVVEAMGTEGGPLPVLCVAATDEGVTLTLAYEPFRISQATAVDFLQKIGLVLAALRAHPDLPCGALELLTPFSSGLMPDLSQVLDAQPFPTVPSTFFDVAERQGDQCAIVGSWGRYTYRDLAAAARMTASELRAAGLTPGDTVAIAGVSSFGTVASMLGVLAAGGVIAIIDRALPEARQEMIETAAAPRLVIEVGNGGIHAGGAAALHRADWPDRAELARYAEMAPSAAEILADLPQDASAYIFFTSGSTGAPKGVLGTHLGLAHFLTWQRDSFPLGPGDRAAQLTALSFDVVLRDILYPLTSGACLHIPPRELLFDAVRMLRWIETEGITTLHSVPSLMKAWLRALDDETPFAGLRYVFFAGEPLVDTLLNRVRRAASPQLKIVNLYGPTETTLAKLANPLDRIEPGVQPVGRPQPGTDVVILRDRRNLCGLWETGEITIRTPYRSKGYLNNDELTRSVFVPNPLRDDPEDRLYFTGDLGRFRSDGKIEIFGRIDSQIKIRGVRIEPNEIEGMLAGLDGVKDAAVTTRPGANDSKILVALVVPQADVPEQRQAEVVRDLRDGLASGLHEAMVPSRFFFVDALPYLPNGKLDRKAIGAMQLEPATEREKRADLPALDADARAFVEAIGAALNTSVKDLSKTFIDLGGDSLSYIEVSILIEKRIGRLPQRWEKMPLSDLLALGRQDGAPGRLPASWVGIEMPIVLRSIAIVLVAMSHTAAFPNLAATSILFVVSGLTFAKFMRPTILETGDASAVWKLILKFAIPAALWLGLRQVVEGYFWFPELVLIGTFFQNGAAPHFTLWFLDILAANLVILALISKVWFHMRPRLGPAVRVPVTGFAFDLALTAFGFAVAFAQVLSGWWDGQVGHTSVAPFKWFWMLALGMLIFSADTRGRKLVATALLGLVAAAAYAELPIFSEPRLRINAFFFGAGLLLIWVNRISVPRLLRKPLTVIASSTLFIYIVNYAVIFRMESILGVTQWPIQVAAAVILGVCVRACWERLLRLGATLLQARKYDLRGAAVWDRMRNPGFQGAVLAQAIPVDPESRPLQLPGFAPENHGGTLAAVQLVGTGGGRSDS
ncbi:amino acid adenylation domain-containing protein [Ostreiculturibacter nitratireducens]|uniref:non-ribosomal peptide synthetase n=1 Tax=Ostreiculturibacter nitratireducens TaxID=3075226 RepID=UPI0031B62450